MENNQIAEIAFLHLSVAVFIAYAVKDFEIRCVANEAFKDFNVVHEN